MTDKKPTITDVTKSTINNWYSKPFSLKSIVDSIKDRFEPKTPEEKEIAMRKAQIKALKLEKSRQKLLASLRKEQEELEEKLKGLN